MAMPPTERSNRVVDNGASRYRRQPCESFLPTASRRSVKSPGRTGFNFDAARELLDALVSGNGSMAQFSHPEFSGSGQWMRGGMTMVSDMFNHRLAARVDAFASELSGLLVADAESRFEYWIVDLRRSQRVNR